MLFYEVFQRHDGELTPLQTHQIDPAELEGWLEEQKDKPNRLDGEPPRDGPRLRCLRLFSSFPLPFNAKSFMEILEVFDIPSVFLRICEMTEWVLIFNRLTKDSRDFLCILKLGGLIAAWSYCVQTNTTSAVFLCSGNPNSMRQNFEHDLRNSGAHAVHPLFIPTVVLSRRVDRSIRETSDLTDAARDFRELSGFNKHGRADVRFFNDIDASVKAMAFAIKELSIEDAIFLRLLDFCQDDLPEGMNKLHELLDCKTYHKEGDHLQHCAMIKRQKGQLHLTGMDIQLQYNYKAKVLRDLSFSNKERITNIETDLLGFNSLVSLRNSKQSIEMANTSIEIANASKRDSSSMKSLAVLSIIFLPPSTIAAIVSVPMLSWQPSDFWIFWAITVPITAVTIVLWAAWMRWVQHRNRMSDKRATQDYLKESGFTSP
ncbi:hypothetical protein HDK90DRAFT_13947 [Phyllosticta capitalensis]|uniref:Uncharacterized protein n=1 Tax=Phyllosticta capitalensis TaxID=121624 RepID=A0ABR1Z2N0_9PEZI